ncbi:MAG: hypothetical protein ACRDRZ_01600 [Pseudonocardiaceae bacterium]
MPSVGRWAARVRHAEFKCGLERSLESLTRDGQSRSEAARAAILEAERAHRRSRLRAEAEAEAEELRNDPDDVAASRELAAEMDALRAG